MRSAISAVSARQYVPCSYRASRSLHTSSAAVMIAGSRPDLIPYGLAASASYTAVTGMRRPASLAMPTILSHAGLSE